MRPKHLLERDLRSTIPVSWKARLKIESKNKSYFSTTRLRRIMERCCAQINFEVGILEAARSKPITQSTSHARFRAVVAGEKSGAFDQETHLPGSSAAPVTRDGDLAGSSITRFVVRYAPINRSVEAG
jgi:hypothetical protein